MKTFALTITLLLCIPGWSQDKKDTLFFNNGSVVIGELKSAKLGVVKFDPDDANDITVQLRKIQTIAAGRRIFRIETVGDRQYFGRIYPHPSPNTIYVVRRFDTLTQHLENISKMYPLEKGTLQRFSGSLGLGYSYTRSSGFGRLNFDGDIRYLSRRTELVVFLSAIYTLYDSLVSRDKEAFAFKYNNYFLRNWFTTAFLAYQRNLELSLQRRYQEGFGIGNKFITSKHIYAWGRSGLVFNQEKSTAGTASGVLTELFGQLELNFFQFEDPKINFMLEQTFYYSLSQSGRFRNDGSLSITWEIFNDFNLSFDPYNNFDSKPPVKGSRQFDFGIALGISYTF